MNECYFCDSTEDIEEHHILPQRFDGSDAETNTVDVCHDCHWKLERLYNKDFWEAIGVDDPRATKESHVSCDIHSCMNPSVERFSTSTPHNHPGKRQGGIVHRCEEHSRNSEGQNNSKRTEVLNIEKAENIDEYLTTDSKRFINDLEWLLNDFLAEDNLSQDDIDEAVGNDRVSEIRFSNNTDYPVNKFRAVTQERIYLAEFVGGYWRVKVESVRQHVKDQVSRR